MSAEEALQYGLIDAIVQPDELKLQNFAVSTKLGVALREPEGS